MMFPGLIDTQRTALSLQCLPKTEVGVTEESDGLITLGMRDIVAFTSFMVVAIFETVLFLGPFANNL